MGRRRFRTLLVAMLLAGTAASAAGGERWGWLGIRIRDLSEAEMDDLSVKLGVREGYGVVIAEILKDTPAEASLLRAGDLIVAIDGRPVVETRALQRMVGGTAAGRELRLVVLREGRRREVTVRAGQMPPEMLAERLAAEFGFAIRGADAEGAREAPEARPVVVAAVADRSAAARGGLVAGDRIVAVNGDEVRTLEHFRQRLEALRLRDPMRLRVERRGELVDLALPPAQTTLPSQ